MPLVRDMANKTYFNIGDFLRDFEEHNLRSGFRLVETVFQELVGEMALNKDLATRINDEAVVLLMAAEDKHEIGSVIEMAEILKDG